MEIEASMKLIHSLIGDATVAFEIPMYQRPYEWDVANVGTLLHDLHEHVRTEDFDIPSSINIEGNKSKYLLGGIVLYRSEAQQGNAKVHVIDGQQRLTTITLIAVVLYKCIQEFYRNCCENGLGVALQASYMNSFISPLERLFRFEMNALVENQELRPKIIVPPQVQSVYSRCILLNYNDRGNLDVMGRRYIENCRTVDVFFERYANSGQEFGLPELQNDDNLGRLNRLCVFAGVLLRHTRLCEMLMKSPIGTQEAHGEVIGIFGKINARGRDLTASDKLKVDFLAKITNVNGVNVASRAGQSWDQVFANMAPESMDVFFNAIYPAYEDNFPNNYSTAWRSRIDQHHGIYAHLVNEILELARVDHIDAFPNLNENGRFNIRLLKILNFNEWQSVVYKARINNNQGDDFEKLLKVCFCLAVLGSHDATRKRDIATIFLNNAQNGDAHYQRLAMDALNRFNTGDVYTMGAAKRKFILNCVSRVLNGNIGMEVDAEHAHVEHVLPQNSGNWVNGGGWTHASINEWQHKIGNLVYLPTRINIAISNLGWVDKRNAIIELCNNNNINVYAYGLRFCFDQTPLANIDWTPAYVEQRHNHIVGVLRGWLGLNLQN